MPNSAQRAARQALDAGRSSLDLLERLGPHESGPAIVELWSTVQDSLRSLAGTTALTGQALVHELRQRDLLSLDDAHRLVDLRAAVERIESGDYTPTAADAVAARAAFEALESATAREPYSAPRAHTGPVSTDALEGGQAPPKGVPLTTEVIPARANWLGGVLTILAVLALLSVAVFYFFQARRGGTDLARGKQAYAVGDRAMAKRAFAAVIAAEPSLAEPHIYLGRMAREEGDMATASAELRRAVELEPENALAHRELAAFLLASGRADLARTFYDRALRIDPSDRNALGFMGCTLMQLGRPDLAQRFMQRAGAGPWQECLRVLQPSPAQAPNAVPPQ